LKKTLETILSALAAAQVRFLVVGGVAVIAHGYLRATQDLDLILDLDPHQARRALAVLKVHGYLPLVPVPIEQFADSEARARWRKEKGAVVFQLYSDRFPTVRVDLFLDEPAPFADLWERAAWFDIVPGTPVPFIGLEDLLAMKRSAGRDQDLLDVRNLQWLRRLRAEQGGDDD
jgi:hypothetical protein